MVEKIIDGLIGILRLICNLIIYIILFALVLILVLVGTPIVFVTSPIWVTLLLIDKNSSKH